MPPPLIRLASCSKLVKCFSNLRWKSVRSLAYTTCSDVSDSSSNTGHPLEKLDKFYVTETLDQLKRERSSALSFIRQLKESGFKHDLETYMAVVRLICHWDWGTDVRSDTLLNDVIDNTNWQLDTFGISDDLFEALSEEKLIEAVEVLVELYASVGRFEEAIHTLSVMKSRGGLEVSTRNCNRLMRELIDWDKVDMVESVYTQLKRNGLIPDVHTYGILMIGRCRRGCMTEAWDLFEEMKEAGVEPDAFVYDMYISGLCRKGKADLALQVVKNLRESNKLVGGFAYACVILGLVGDLKLQDAEDVFLDMKLREVVPDVYCYRALIKGYCLKGDMDKALDLCKEMESGGIKVDHMFVRSMLQFLCHCRRFAEALCMFKHFMKESRVFLDEVSFNIAIGVASKLGKMDDAMVLVAEMKGRKIKPIVMHAQDFEPTGVQGQCVQQNVGQHEGAEGVPDTSVQSEGVHEGVVKDAMDQGRMHYVGKVHTSQQTLAIHHLTNLNAHHAVLLKKLRKFERHMSIRKAVDDKDDGGSSLDKPVQLDEA